MKINLARYNLFSIFASDFHKQEKCIMYDQLKLENQMCFRLYTAARLVTNAYRPFFEPLGITYPQYLVLMVLWEHDNLTISEISDKLGLESNTITPLLQRMEKLGLVVRTRGAVDGRQRLVSLTKAGKAMEERCKDVPTCLMHNILSESDENALQDMMALAPLLDKLIMMLKK